MADLVPNPDASVVVTAPPGPPSPQVQQPPNAPTQIPPAPGPQQFQSPSQAPPPSQPGPWHRAVQALLGSTTEYTQTPNGPVPTQVPNKPGNLFRSILAGAILGAGAGTANAEHSAGSGWNAAGQGAAAAQKGAQAQQQQRQKQAQQQFENQRQANQDTQEEMVRKAQIAQANAETLRINKEVQGTDYTQHKQIADAGKASVQPYEDAGINAVASDLTESQMHQYFQDHPGAGALDWEPVDVKTVLTKDAQGNEVPTYEMVYSAYDPKGKVTVPQSTINEWKKAGVFDRYPEYGTVLSNGKTMDAKTYVQVKRDAEKVIGDNLAKTNQNLETTLKQTQIDAAKAEITDHLATAAHERAETGKEVNDEKEKNALDTAWTHLSAAGNDPNKSPMTAEDRITLARNAQPIMQDTLNAIKVAANDPSQADQLPDLWNTYHSLARLATLGGSATTTPISVVFNGQAGVFNTQADADAFIKAHPGATVAGAAPPQATTAPPAPQPWGQHSTPAEDLQRGLQNAPAPTLNQAAVSF